MDALNGKRHNGSELPQRRSRGEATVDTATNSANYLPPIDLPKLEASENVKKHHETIIEEEDEERYEKSSDLSKKGIEKRALYDAENSPQLKASK
jgi:hypothetical protein